MKEITVANYRCLRECQTARLAPITLLVGDNSTGKTSLLGLIRALWSTAFGDRLPNFKEDPYDLGSFEDIVSRGLDGVGPPAFFRAGFRAASTLRPGHLDHGDGAISITVEFTQRASAPFPTTRRLELADHWLEHSVQSNNKHAVAFGRNLPGGSSASTPIKRAILPDNGVPFIPFEMLPQALLHRPAGASPRMPDADRMALGQMFRALRAGSQRPFASAPVRSRPRRSYDPASLQGDPEGGDIPMYFAHLLRSDRSKWSKLKASIDRFGSRAGLFDSIDIRQFGESHGDPFQIQVRRVGSSKWRTSHYNLVDVGYGVSQVLPIVTEICRPGAAQMLLLQQPEVHLHPSAQAALGSLFCDAATRNRQLVIETHSDYIVDRVRMDVRDRTTELSAEDVSLLFFERGDSGVRIHSLRFDEEGNVVGAPDSYGRFFMSETSRSVGLV